MSIHRPVVIPRDGVSFLRLQTSLFLLLFFDPCQQARPTKENAGANTDDGNDPRFYQLSELCSSDSQQRPCLFVGQQGIWIT